LPVDILPCTIILCRRLLLILRMCPMYRSCNFKTLHSMGIIRQPTFAQCFKIHSYETSRREWRPLGEEQDKDGDHLGKNKARVEKRLNTWG
jgi:hypothetical protein